MMLMMTVPGPPLPTPTAPSFLEWFPFGDVGPWALVAFIVVLIVRSVVKGDFVPRKTVEDIIHDRDEWRAAHRISEAARQEERDQKRELLEHARTTTAVISSLPTNPPEQEEPT